MNNSAITVLGLKAVLPDDVELTPEQVARTFGLAARLRVRSRVQNSPPVGVINGDVYIIAGSPTGPWDSRPTQIAGLINGRWAFVIPEEGWCAWVLDEDAEYVFNGTAWVAFSSGGSPGATGAAGARGPQGEDGPEGPAGIPGATGVSGASGPMGPMGPQGEEGPEGQFGTPGPQGIAGTTGQTGAEFFVQDGDEGPMGPPGVAGSSGPLEPVRTPHWMHIQAGTNNTAAFTSQVCYAQYLGKADKSHTTVNVVLNVTTLMGATITYAEVAIATGPLVWDTDAVLTTRGFLDTSAVWNTTGIKKHAITCAGISPGDDMWALFSVQTSGAFPLFRAALPEQFGMGMHQNKAATRPSTMAAASTFTHTGLTALSPVYVLFSPTP